MYWPRIIATVTIATILAACGSGAADDNPDAATTLVLEGTSSAARDIAESATADDSVALIASAQDLRNRTNEATRAIIVPAERIEDIGAEWLFDQYLQGIVLVGLDVSWRELSQIVRHSPGTVPTPTYDTPHWSLASHHTCNNGGGRSMTSWRYTSLDALRIAIDFHTAQQDACT